jgi:hypothetical protein
MTGSDPAGSSTSWPRARIHLSLASLLAGAIGALAILLACGGSAPPPPPATPAAAAPPAAAAEPAKTAGCARDMDCKGERVCEAGECVNPQ